MRSGVERLLNYNLYRFSILFHIFKQVYTVVIDSTYLLYKKLSRFIVKADPEISCGRSVGCGLGGGSPSRHQDAHVTSICAHFMTETGEMFPFGPKSLQGVNKISLSGKS